MLAVAAVTGKSVCVFLFSAACRSFAGGLCLLRWQASRVAACVSMCAHRQAIIIVRMAKIIKFLRHSVRARHLIAERFRFFFCVVRVDINSISLRMNHFCRMRDVCKRGEHVFPVQAERQRTIRSMSSVARFIHLPHGAQDKWLLHKRICSTRMIRLCFFPLFSFEGLLSMA